MAGNSNLQDSRKQKADEFYTPLSMIENELKHYREHFKGKTVLCNCDDPRVSNFFRYFVIYFEVLGIKKVIATCYKNNNADLFSQEATEKAVCLEYEGNPKYTSESDFARIPCRELKGNGDFSSEECVEFLKEADIVCTNPPFSLSREYVPFLFKYNKKFLIIGNINNITYHEIIPLIKNKKMKRQKYLETAIRWHANAKTDGEIRAYMGAHQTASDALELWTYYQSVITWVKAKFKVYRKEMKGIDWGLIYNKFDDETRNAFDAEKIEAELKKYFGYEYEDQITNKKGIFEYVLDHDERHLNIRAFKESEKCAAYEKQGGKTELSNLQMLCKDCNRRKSDR